MFIAHPREPFFVSGRCIGHPRDVIVQVAKEVGADVIVMGTHGCRSVSQVFIGSVADHVVRHAPVPVMVVRVGDAAPYTGRGDE